MAYSKAYGHGMAYRVRMDIWRKECPPFRRTSLSLSIQTTPHIYNTSSLMPTELFTSKATYPNNIVIPPVALRHPAYYTARSWYYRGVMKPSLGLLSGPAPSMFWMREYGWQGKGICVLSIALLVYTPKFRTRACNDIRGAGSKIRHSDAEASITLALDRRRRCSRTCKKSYSRLQNQLPLWLLAKILFHDNRVF